MQVDVRDALADARVREDERALRAERTLQRDGHATHDREERGEGVVGKIVERLVVRRRDDERVALDHRCVVEEGDCVLVGVHEVMVRAGDDLAEDTGLRPHRP